VGIFGNIFNFLLTLLLTLILLIEEGGVTRRIMSMLPINQKDYILAISKKINSKISAWFTGQVFIMLLTAVANSLFFWAIGVPYALTLGVIAFFFEAIPNIGPILAAVPAIIIAYTSNPWKALAVFIFIILFHVIGSQFLVPKIMSKAINTSAFIIVLGLLIGGKIAGALGMVLALPVITVFSVISQEYPNIMEKIRENSHSSKTTD